MCVCVCIDACGCMWKYTYMCVCLRTPAQAYRCEGAFLMTHTYAIYNKTLFVCSFHL